MKICLISFDHWEYDHYIIKSLQKKNIEAFHINTGKFKHSYATPLHKVGNFLSKIILNRNIKKIKRYEYILSELDRMGPMDKILIINPELIPLSVHRQIREHTKNYIAYLYDSSKRYPVDHLLNGLFSSIYSFDKDDVNTYGFLPVSNYIYQDKKEIKSNETFTWQVFIILSADERLGALNNIATALQQQGITFKFIVVSKKDYPDMHSGITLQKNIVRQPELTEYFDQSQVFLDLLRKDQSGLSFRVFESLAYQKKLITTNPAVKDYDFYNPQNIMVIDPENIVIDPAFFTTPYIPLPEDIYYKYTVDGWTDHVFGALPL